MFAEMTELYYKNVPQNQLPDIYEKTIFRKRDANDKESYADYTAYVFAHTFLADSNKFNSFCENPSPGKLKSDAAMQYTISFITNYMTNFQPKSEAFNYKKAELSKEYVHELMEQQKDKLSYPDANST